MSFEHEDADELPRPGSEGYFTPSRDPRLFFCACNRPECDAPSVSTDLLARLNVLRYRVGRAIVVNSGPRCDFWNTHEGGKPRTGPHPSDHLFGEGADLQAPTSGERDELLEAIYTKPRLFVRVGVGPNFVHVGLSGTQRPARVCWTYYKAKPA